MFVVRTVTNSQKVNDEAQVKKYFWLVVAYVLFLIKIEFITIY